MRIGIDMRMAGSGEGIGRYIEELVSQLLIIDQENDYVLLFAKENQDFAEKFLENQQDVERVFLSSRYYSFAEQTKLIAELISLKLDLVHFASFNAPIFYPKKFITTIHDIIHHHFPGKKKSRFLHRAAYRAVMRSAVKRAEKVIAVSGATRADLLKTYRIPAEKIIVIYEGIDQKFAAHQLGAELAAVRTKYKITKPYLLFVGVWRQYKNLPMLAQAFDLLKQKYGLDYQLVLAGKIDPFYPEIKKQVFSIKNNSDVLALGYVPDQDLVKLYKGARLFVLPSLIEGFGLIGVEAQAAGLPVAASDIPVLREVLGESAVYFDPTKKASIAESVSQVLTDQDLSEKLRQLGQQNVKRFNWTQAAGETLAVYKEVLEK